MTVLKGFRELVISALIWIGVAAGSVSTYSILVQVFKIDVIPQLQKVISEYTLLVDPVREYINLAPLPFEVNTLYFDCIILYFVFLIMSFKSISIGFKLDEYKKKTQNFYDALVFKVKNNSFSEKSKVLSFFQWITLFDILTFYPLRAFLTVKKRNRYFKDHLDEFRKAKKIADKLLIGKRNSLSERDMQNEMIQNIVTYNPENAVEISHTRLEKNIAQLFYFFKKSPKELSRLRLMSSVLFLQYVLFPLVVGVLFIVNKYDIVELIR